MAFTKIAAAGIGSTGTVTLQTLVVTGGLSAPSGDALINRLTIGIGSGQVSSNTAIGFSALYSNTNGSQNTTNGYQNLFSNTQGSNNTASGYQALYSNQTANYNVAVGAQSLYSNVGGGGNVAVGGLSLYSNNANNNTAVGTLTLYSNTTGIDNTAIGNQALSANTTGWYNSAIGRLALGFNTTGSNNTSSGFQSLYFNARGDNNVANGFQSLLSNVSGSYNVAVGYQAGYNVTGSNNVLIGPAAGSSSNPTYQPPIADGSNQLVIGAGNTAWIYGNSSYNVGIGTTNPTSKLQVVGSANISSNLGIGTTNPQTNLHIGGTTDKSIRINTSTNNAGFFGVYQDTAQVTVNRDGANGSFVDANKSAATIVLSGESGGSYISLATAAANNTPPSERVRLTSSGNIGIGLTNPSFLLQLGPGNFGNVAGLGGIAFDANNGVIFNTYGTGGGLTLRAQRTSDTGGGQIFLGGSARGDGYINTITFSTGNTDRMTVTSSGYVSTPNSSSGTFGLDIGYRKSISITGTFSANTWYNTGIDRTTDGGGIYLVNCYFDTYLSSGQSYNMRYVGWFTFPNQYTNSGDTSAIALHRSGHAPNSETLQLRTALTGGADGKSYLQWLSNFNNVLDGTGGKNFQLVLHRFATPLGG